MRILRCQAVFWFTFCKASDKIIFGVFWHEIVIKLFYDLEIIESSRERHQED